MKKMTYTYPKSSFLSVEKDMDIIVNMILKNDRLKKLLYYTTKDCLDRPNLTEDESLELFEENIKWIPRIILGDGSEAKNYLMINFDNFSPNFSNPEFRDNILEFDIMCPYELWNLGDFSLRPFKIAAELDTIFNHQRLTGIGQLEFLSASKVVENTYGGLCLRFLAIHGEEDKKYPLNPNDNEDIIDNFDRIFNDE